MLFRSADAIKLQTYTADTLTLNCKRKDFKITQGTLWDGRYLYDLYQQAYTPWEWHEELFHVAHEEGIVCFSSPFDKSAVDLLESLRTPIYKIASPEIVDIPLIEYTASTMKPIVLSTGVATYEDISLAIETCRKVGNQDITVLKCTTAYPAPIEEANLCMLKSYSEEFGVKNGLSTCCEADMTFLGFMCKWKDAEKYKTKEWVKVRAKVGVEYQRDYHGEGPVLYAENVEKAAEIKDIVQF